MTRRLAEPTIPPPYVYGLPADKFAEWRPYQPTAVVRALETDKRFPVIVAPTGFGKSPVGETIARYAGRSAYLTITKALQDQIGKEIADRFDLRGKNNYDCRVLSDAGLTGWRGKVDQADGMCEGCEWHDRGCRYYDDHRQARNEPHLLTNYAKWLTSDQDQLGEFDVLVCDEAHGAVEQLSAAMRIEIDPATFDRFADQPMPDSELPIDEWRQWAGKWWERLGPQLDALKVRVGSGERNRLAELRQLRGLVRALDNLRAVDDTWLEDRTSGGPGGDAKVGFESLWPRRYGERLWRGTKRIVLMSATVTRKDLALLGVQADQIDFAEYPSGFPVDRRPVISVRTVAQRASMSDGERLEAVRRVDQIIDQRLDRKGIIHTVSFERARHLVANSRHRARMLMNDPSSRNPELATKAVVERYRAANESVWLVTPSAIEGWDFPYSDCETIILLKVPLLNRHASKIVDARCKDDPEYDLWQAMKKVVQMFGRGMRAADDRCEGIILDDTWDNWFLRAAKRFAPQWFMAAVRGPEMIPRPLDKLRR